MINNQSILLKSKRITIGLIVSGTLVAILSGYALSTIFQAIERNEMATKLVYLLDNARLQELVFTRDKSKEAADNAKETLKEILQLAENFHESNSYNAKNTQILVDKVQKYQNGFNQNVVLYEESIESKSIMVAAARKATASTEALQNLQEKYLDQDKASVRKYRNDMASIMENASMSYELVVMVELSRNYEMSYLMFRNQRDLELASFELDKMAQTINTLTLRIKNKHSKDILSKIAKQHDKYQKALLEIDAKTKSTDKAALKLKSVAMNLRRAALSLQQNEKDLLFNIQSSVTDLQELLAKRLDLSKEVIILMNTISDSRQADRDFSLAKTEDGKDIFIQQVLRLLESAIYRSKKISTMLIEEDEKVIFKNVQSDINIYLENFKNVIIVFQKSNVVSRAMIESALLSDKILTKIRDLRYQEMQQSQNVSFYSSLLGTFIFVVIGFLIILIYKLQGKLVGSLEESIKDVDAQKILLETLFVSAPDAITLLHEGKWVDCNPATLKLFGAKSKDDFLDKLPSQLSPEFQPDGQSSKDKVYNAIEKAFKTGSYQMEWEHIRLDNGETFICEVILASMMIKEEAHIYGIIRDITQRKALEKEILVHSKNLEEAKIEVETIHKHTRDSIEYAALIQGALIPDKQIFKNNFSDYFSIWKPKDIVGGDIYLLEELRNKDECLLMVIDCTGHGVPGAFVTMLVKAIERQVIAKINNDKDIDVSPAWILSYFNKTMKKLLQQENSDSISNAGFDGGVIYYNKKEKILKFAGAETPLFYIEDEELKTIKGSRQSVGYKTSDINFEFKEHIIDVKEGMQFYCTTDGYLDQNGGEKSFPFSKKRFTNNIKDIHGKLFKDQEKLLLSALVQYQGDEETNDDVTLIAFQI